MLIKSEAVRPMVSGVEKPFTFVWVRPVPLFLREVEEEVSKRLRHLVTPMVLQEVIHAIREAFQPFDMDSAFLVLYSGPSVAGVEEAREYVEANKGSSRWRRLEEEGWFHAIMAWAEDDWSERIDKLLKGTGC